MHARIYEAEGSTPDLLPRAWLLSSTGSVDLGHCGGSPRIGRGFEVP